MIVVVCLAICLFYLFYTSYSIGSGFYIRSFCKKNTDEKVVALTFDDGPDVVQTPKVLDVLKKYQVPACFFCIGSKINSNEDLLRRIISEGHLVGNHSYTHSKTFPVYSFTRMKNDLEACQRLLDAVLPEKSTLFRPPFGVTNPTIARVVKALGFKSIGWNVRSLDTSGKHPEFIMKRLKKKIAPGSVLLLHDRMPHSDVLLSLLLEYLGTEGYRVERIDRWFD